MIQLPSDDMPKSKRKPHSQVRSTRLLAAARGLCERLRVIHADELYKSVWFCAWNHGINYENGPTYTKELGALEAEIESANTERIHGE